MPGALAQLLQLLDHMAAADELMERFDQGIEALASLPAGHSEVRLLGTRYASVQIWARKGRFAKASGVIDAMLRGLGVRLGGLYRAVHVQPGFTAQLQPGAA
jgi:hypothetical protein